MHFGMGVGFGGDPPEPQPSSGGDDREPLLCIFGSEPPPPDGHHWHYVEGEVREFGWSVYITDGYWWREMTPEEREAVR